MSFIEKYNSIKSLVEPELNELKAEMLKGFEEHENLYEYISAPSKNIRPVLTFLFLKASGYEITQEQTKVQAAVELIHNASLLHDDVIDESETRRQFSSFNKKEGNRLAVISGDFVLSLALKKLVETGSTEILNIFATTLKKMCLGEIFQNKSKFQIPTMEDYLEKTYNKTGALFEASLKAALPSGKSAEFAKNFGIAFQIRDDILNITNKSADSDILNGIYTAPVIYSGNPDNPLEGIEKAKDLLDTYLERAGKCIQILPQNKYKSTLTELTEILKI